MTNTSTKLMLELAILWLYMDNEISLEKEGIASYYTVESSSNLTASGERLRDDAYTAAMRDGEFGDYYLVEANNGNSVIVRLNDRGPYHPNRVIDLSKAAMRELCNSSGLIHVEIYKLGDKIPSGLKSN